MSDNTYQAPTVTVDSVLVRNVEGELEILIHERPREPFAGQEAIPGVYVNAGETIASAAQRALSDKTGISEPRFIKTVDVADAIARDPRGHAISIVTQSFTTLASSENLTDGARWVRYSEIDSLNLAFDHADIIHNVYASMKRELLMDSRVLRGLTLEANPLTTSHIVRAFRALGDNDGTSNIRRRLRVSRIARETAEISESTGPGRPSKIWEFIEN